MKFAEIRGVRELFRGLLRLALLIAFASGVSLTLTSEAHAYAWLIKHRYGGCPTCHADPSGGELLTAYGQAQGEYLLRMPYGDASHGAKPISTGEVDLAAFAAMDSDEDSAAAGESSKSEPAPAEESDSGVGAGAFLWGAVPLPDPLLLGGGFRVAFLKKMDLKGADGATTPGTTKVFPMMADVYGQYTAGHFRVAASIGVTKAPAGSPHGRPAQVTGSQDDGLNMISRTHWLGYEFGDSKYLLRAGRINLPYGLRIPEHVMWVRETTRTDRESDQQHGVALSYNVDGLRAEVMGIAGNFQMNPDEYRERGYAGYVEGMLDEQNAFGVSSLWTTAARDRLTLESERHTRTANGVFWRLTLAEPLVLFGEVDAVTNSRRDLGYVGLLQGDYEITQGLHFIGSVEVQDQGYKFARPPAVPGGEPPRTVPSIVVPGAGKPNTGFWASADWYFYSHMSLRVDAVFRHNEATQILGQLHVYL